MRPARWSTKIQLVAPDARCAIAFSRSPGQAGGAAGKETRQPARDLGFIPIAPPLWTRAEGSLYLRPLQKTRHHVHHIRVLLARSRGISIPLTGPGSPKHQAPGSAPAQCWSRASPVTRIPAYSGITCRYPRACSLIASNKLRGGRSCMPVSKPNLLWNGRHSR